MTLDDRETLYALDDALRSLRVAVDRLTARGELAAAARLQGAVDGVMDVSADHVAGLPTT